MTVGQTPRMGLTTWSSDLDQVDRAQFAATVTALDQQGVPDYYDLATNINNYAASAGSWFFAMDTMVHYVGTGSSWQPVLRRVDTTVTNATLPAASTGNKGNWYWTSDTLKLYRSNGASMILIETPASAPPAEPPAVGTIITLLPGASVNAASTTWLPCDGRSLASVSYPALFAEVGHQYGGSGASFHLPTVGGFQGIGRPSQLTIEGSPQTASFTYIGGAQTWTVPSAGTWGGSATFTAVGGSGGGFNNGSSIIDTLTGAAVTFSVAVSPSQGYTIYVGGYGGATTAAAGSPTTQNFSYTGSTQSFTVPSNLWGGTITVTCVGAGGGGIVFSEGTPSLGASVTATIPATSGEVLTVYVGGEGGQGASGNGQSGTGIGGAGGYGYGAGGAGGTTANVGGGGGGGSSAITSGTTPLVVAGGGAGSGTADTSPAPGGNGGTSNGGTGATAYYSGYYGYGGTGGTGSGPGAGGTATGSAAVTGASGAGPNGGGGATTGAGAGAGGGGGGFYGGGGGGATTFIISNSAQAVAGGGGGGSSYVSTGTGVGYTVASSYANGSVSITYTPTTGSGGAGGYGAGTGGSGGGGGGGGLTGIALGATWISLTAGGGGVGVGDTGATLETGGAGGTPNGGNGSPNAWPYDMGAGATASGPGAGGSGVGAVAGSPGSGANGGAGASGWGAGGGGAGLYGGGGGGAVSYSGNIYVGGGGGGYSYTNPSCQNVSYSNGPIGQQNGYVVVNWTGVSYMTPSSDFLAYIRVA